MSNPLPINWLHDLPPAWLDGTVMFLRIAFMVSAGLFVLQLSRRFRQTRGAGGPNRLLAAICILALGAILVHQGIWQLAGFRNAKFVAFMGRYSPRVAGSGESMQRGRIVDRNGIVLAETVAGQRRYPHGPAAAHVTGYADARYGTTGVERADDAHLRGAAVSIDSASLQRLARNLIDHRLIAGNDTVLTIDARLQAEAYRLLGDDAGAVVAISPRDGSILVLASTPSFDPSSPGDALEGGKQALFNRALAGLYPPGSTFKALVAAVACDYRMGGPMTCPAEGIAAEAGARPIRDHEYYEYERLKKRWRGHGTIDIREGLVRSSNVYFAKLGLLLGAPRMNEISRRFALEQPYRLFEGSSGSIVGTPSRLPRLGAADRRAIAQAAIGQGSVVVTPLHMAVATAAIANDGWLHAPHLNAATTPGAPVAAISPRAAQLVAEYMGGVVRSGTGAGARIRGLPLAGKTGTAQTPSGADHGWFVAFGPTSHPALALAVVVENSGYGSRRAVPIARELFMAAQAMGLLTPAPVKAVSP